jgi:hypothetical protein
MKRIDSITLLLSAVVSNAQIKILKNSNIRKLCMWKCEKIEKRDTKEHRRRIKTPNGYPYL